MTYTGFEAFMHDAPAVEALRKARATKECADYGVPIPGCFFGEPLEFDRLAMWDNGLRHGDAASALLDGFSVDEVTAAEEVLA